MISTMLLGVAVAAACAPGVSVRTVSDRTFDVEAKNVPVSSVLRCLSDEAGFRLIIDSGIPVTQPVTLRLQNQTALQSVGSILEGLTLNYALSTEPAQGRLLMLMITGRTGASTAAVLASAPGASTGGSGVRPPTGTTAPRRIMPFRPPDAAVEPEPEEGLEDLGGAVQHPFVPPMENAPLYPEAQPLSPQTLRGGRRVVIAAASPVPTLRTVPSR